MFKIYTQSINQFHNCCQLIARSELSFSTKQERKSILFLEHSSPCAVSAPIKPHPPPFRTHALPALLSLFPNSPFFLVMLLSERNASCINIIINCRQRINTRCGYLFSASAYIKEKTKRRRTRCKKEHLNSWIFMRHHRDFSVLSHQVRIIRSHYFVKLCQATLQACCHNNASLSR